MMAHKEMKRNVTFVQISPLHFVPVEMTRGPRFRINYGTGCRNKNAALPVAVFIVPVSFLPPE